MTPLECFNELTKDHIITYDPVGNVYLYKECVISCGDLNTNLRNIFIGLSTSIKGDFVYCYTTKDDIIKNLKYLYESITI